MKLSEELKQWGYHASLSEGGLKQHLEMSEKAAKLEEENELVKLLVTSRVKGEWPDGMNGDPDDWEEWSLQLYGREAGDLLLGQEAWDHIARGLKQEPE